MAVWGRWLFCRHFQDPPASGVCDGTRATGALGPSPSSAVLGSPTPTRCRVHGPFPLHDGKRWLKTHPRRGHAQVGGRPGVSDSTSNVPHSGFSLQLFTPEPE